VPSFITEKQLHPKLRARINVSYWAVVLLAATQAVVIITLVGILLVKP